MCTEDESRYAARKGSEVELEVEGDVRRGVDKALMMRALSDMTIVVREVYKNIESEMQNIASEAHHKYMLDGRGVIDGPRRDILKKIRDVLVPSCEHQREFVMHEFFR